MASQPLNIVIVGAGIAGLYAGIALKKAGHDVEIYESSRFATETGAAIHLQSNANGLLLRIGIKPEQHGGVTTEWISEYRPSGELVFSKNVAGLNHAFPYPWQLCHRVDLHNALKQTAKEAGVTIHLQSRVESVDVEASEITLSDGRKVKGDLIIGADGTHSVTRKYVAGPDSVSKPSGTSAFRFLIDVDTIRADPATAHFAEKDGELRLLYGADRRIVVYPCRDNKELNFVCLHPDEESDTPSDGDWNASASKELVLKIFDSYPADVKALLGHAPDNGIKLWQLLDLPALETWTKNNLVLIGDAAHPFLPHQGQGGAQAIEDAAALAALLPLGTSVSEIPDRLQLYMKARYERATAVQQYTRDSAFPTKRGDHGGKAMEPMQFTMYNFDHDAHDHAIGILNRYTAQKAGYRRMPVSFGPCVSPRQGLDGKPRKASGLNGPVTYHTSYVTVKTKKSYLSTLLPSEEFSISAQGGWSTATFSVTKLGNLAWLGGRGYSYFGLYIHDVLYSGKVTGELATKNEASDKKGDFLPVLFENMADLIITGREELGFSKVFATLESKHASAGLFSSAAFELSAGWEGTEFCHLKIEDLVEDTSSETQDVAEPPVYHWKVIPSSNEKGQVDAEYVSVSKLTLGSDLGGEKKERRWKGGKAEIRFTELVGDELEKAFPTLANVVLGLRGVEVKEVLGCGVRSFP